MRTPELTGAALDWAVAKCEGRSLGVMTAEEQAERFMKNREVNPSPEVAKAYASIVAGLKAVLCSIDPEDGYKAPLYLVNRADYSTDWAQGGPIIEREKIDINATLNQGSDADEWRAVKGVGQKTKTRYGTTPLIAAMRCYVASKLGDNIDIPKGL